MEFEVKEVAGTGQVIGSGRTMVPRKLAGAHHAIPDADHIEQAKLRFDSVGLKGASLLIAALQMLEDQHHVVGYFGFTYDRDGLTRTPLSEGETRGERGMKIMNLPHPQWGQRSGARTAISDLVALSEDPNLESISPEQVAILEQMFTDGATFLTRGSSEGES